MENKSKPGLAILLIGDRKDSDVYVKIKRSVAEKIGIEFKLIKLEQTIEQDEVDKIINALNIGLLYL